MSWPSEGLSGDLTPALGFDHKWKKLTLALISVPLPHSHVTRVGGARVSHQFQSFPPIYRGSEYQKAFCNSMLCSTLLGPWCSKLTFLSLCEWICK